MVDKWADYLISAVRYDANHTHIDKVEIREDKGEKIGVPYEETRPAVISNHKKGKTYCTITKGKDGWNKGAMVEILSVNGKEFIRTDKNQIEADNLGELPEF